MKKSNSETGVSTIVEATVILPLCLIVIMALYSTSLYVCQRANLQASLEDALVYYKNEETDTYVTATSQAYSRSDAVTASRFDIGFDGRKFPYRLLWMKFQKNDGGFESLFRQMYRYSFFTSADHVTVTTTPRNYLIYKEISATAEETFTLPIDFSAIGLPSTLTVNASAKVVVADGDEFVRNTDFVVDILADTKLGKTASELVGKVSELYGKFKEVLGIGTK